MLQVLNAARKAELRVFYAPGHRYRPGDYETWKYIAPIQKAAWSHKTFENGTWGGNNRLTVDQIQNMRPPLKTDTAFRPLHFSPQFLFSAGLMTIGTLRGSPKAMR